MKAYLVILLFAFITCALTDDLEKLAKCVISSPTVSELLPKVLEAVKAKDYSNLVKLALAQLPKLKKELMGCISEPTLKVTCDLTKLGACVQGCNSITDEISKLQCLQGCRKLFCH
jgi:hypothetical protein